MYDVMYRSDFTVHHLMETLLSAEMPISPLISLSSPHTMLPTTSPGICHAAHMLRNAAHSLAAI